MIGDKLLKMTTGDIFLTHDGLYIKIVAVNEELISHSYHNKAITVERLDTKEELNLSYAHLDTWGVKYLGRNEGTAWVLYGTNLKKEK